MFSSFFYSFSIFRTQASSSIFPSLAILIWCCGGGSRDQLPLLWSPHAVFCSLTAGRYGRTPAGRPAAHSANFACCVRFFNEEGKGFLLLTDRATRNPFPPVHFIPPRWLSPSAWTVDKPRRLTSSWLTLCGIDICLATYGSGLFRASQPTTVFAAISSWTGTVARWRSHALRSAGRQRRKAVSSTWRGL